MTPFSIFRNYQESKSPTLGTNVLQIRPCSLTGASISCRILPSSTNFPHSWNCFSALLILSLSVQMYVAQFGFSPIPYCMSNDDSPRNASVAPPPFFFSPIRCFWVFRFPSLLPFCSASCIDVGPFLLLVVPLLHVDRVDFTSPLTPANAHLSCFRPSSVYFVRVFPPSPRIISSTP